jgi:hypothetical protein
MIMHVQPAVTPCPCLPCTWSSVDVLECSETNHDLTQVGANHLISGSRWPLVTFLENVTEPPPWKAALESLPNLKTDLLEKFGIKPCFISDQRLLEKESENKMAISNHEISAAFRKLCYLTLIRWSNKQFPPSHHPLN